MAATHRAALTTPDGSPLTDWRGTPVTEGCPLLIPRPFGSHSSEMAAGRALGVTPAGLVLVEVTGASRSKHGKPRYAVDPHSLTVEGDRAATARLAGHLLAMDVPEAAVKAIGEGRDPGRCGNADARAGRCMLDLGHADPYHLCVDLVRRPREMTDTVGTSRWLTGQRKTSNLPERPPTGDSPAMRAHDELLGDKRLFICQPITATLLHVQVQLSAKDVGLASWLRRLGIDRQDVTGTEHGDYLARSILHGARIDFTAHARYYR